MLMKVWNWLRLLGRVDNLGARGEALAAEHLRRALDMKILARNVRCPGGELDIIALDDNDLVFVEVRTRSSEEFTTPEATVSKQKKQFLIRSANWFMCRKRLTRWNPRFDIVAIVWPKDGQPTIRHHRNAFYLRQRKRR
jgi:putative endonuclease